MEEFFDENSDAVESLEGKSFLPADFDKTKLILPGAILIAAVMISGSVLYTKTAKDVTAQIGGPEAGIVEVSVDDDPALGNPKAKVTIVEFSDYQCPFCRTFWKNTWPQLKKDYIDTGKVRFVYRDFPLSFHPAARPAAQASECADEQGKFWEFQDKVFAEQDKKGDATITFTNQDLKRWAKEIGLDTNKFNQCFDSGKYAQEVEKDAQDATNAGINGTPTFFINGKPLVGAQPYSEFKKLIDSEL